MYSEYHPPPPIQTLIYWDRISKEACFQSIQVNLFINIKTMKKITLPTRPNFPFQPASRKQQTRV